MCVSVGQKRVLELLEEEELEGAVGSVNPAWDLCKSNTDFNIWAISPVLASFLSVVTSHTWRTEKNKSN